MKQLIFISVLIFALILSGCTQPAPQSGEKPVLTIYTYDSMVSEYGLGPKVVPEFEKQCNCKVNMVAKGDAGQVLTILKLEKDDPKADVVIGIDNSLAGKAIEAGVLEQFIPRNITIVPQELMFDKSGHLTPYDYGYVAFVYDAQKIDFPPGGFNAMQ